MSVIGGTIPLSTNILRTKIKDSYLGDSDSSFEISWQTDCLNQECREQSYTHSINEFLDKYGDSNHTEPNHGIWSAMLMADGTVTLTQIITVKLPEVRVLGKSVFDSAPAAFKGNLNSMVEFARTH